LYSSVLLLLLLLLLLSRFHKLRGRALGSDVTADYYVRYPGTAMDTN